MNLIQIKCPNCNSKLKCEDGLESYTCPYCESTFILNGQSKNALNAKARIIIEGQKHDNERYEKELEYKDRARKDELEFQKKKYDDKSSLFTIFIMTILLLLICGMTYYILDKPERDLNRLTTNVNQYIEVHDFASARVEAQKIKYTQNFFDFEEKAKWSSIRKELLNQIEKAEKEYKAELKKAEKQAKEEAKAEAKAQKEAEKQAEKEAKAQKEAEKKAEKEAKGKSSFWTFLPWVD